MPVRPAIGLALARKGQAQEMHSRETFRERFLARYRDPAFDAEREAIARLEAIAWDAYQAERKSPVKRPAGAGFAEPQFELQAEWLDTRERLLAAQARWSDAATPSRVLVINGSTRNDGTCPGEVSKSWRLANMAVETLAAAGLQTDLLDLSHVASDYDRHIHPCKGCVSTAMPLCHWPCSCYPNHGLGQVNDWMAEIYERWVSAHGVLLVTPAQALRAACGEATKHMPEGAPAVICAKGIEAASGRLLSEIVAEVLPANPVAVLSGPGFAADVSRGLPTAVTVAARDEELAIRLAALLSAPYLRCYSSSDLTGVEIGGALKNVMAIAAGAASGAELGASAQAALVTRGFVELRRIAQSFGAEPETVMGLSGLGDLLLTCSSAQSRNFAYGLALGRGESLEGRPLAEGVATAGIAARIAADRGIRAPIISAVAAILAGRLTITEAVSALMTRPLRAEAE